MILGKVQSVKILKQTGLMIEFETEQKINVSYVVQINYKEKLKSFYILEVETVNSNLLGRAMECGYFAQKLGINKDLDLRDLVGCDVELVTDSEKLRQINERSSYT